MTCGRGIAWTVTRWGTTWVTVLRSLFSKIFAAASGLRGGEIVDVGLAISEELPGKATAKEAAAMSPVIKESMVAVRS